MSEAKRSRRGDLRASHRRGVLRSVFLSSGIAVALVATAVVSVSGGSSDDLEQTLPAAADATDDSVDGATDDVLDEEAFEVPTVTYDVYLARDPFDPVVPEDEPEVVTAAAGSDSDEDGDAVDAVSGEEGSAGEAGDDPDGETRPAEPSDDESTSERCRGQEEVVCDGQVISLLEIAEVDGEPVAVMQVDTTVYEVRVGETFAERFRLLDISDDQVVVQFGDEVFQPRAGERILK